MTFYENHVSLQVEFPAKVDGFVADSLGEN